MTLAADRPDLRRIAQRFSEVEVTDLREFGSGNINTTFLVSVSSGSCFILQRMNTRVFSGPELVMANMRIAIRHMQERLQRHSLPTGTRWEILRVIPTVEGDDHWRGPDGSFWRALSRIENAQTFDLIRDSRHAEEVGRALGLFHTLLSDLPSDRLGDTLEGFHIMPQYLAHYDVVPAANQGPLSPQVEHAMAFIESRRGIAPLLEDAKAAGRLLIRTIHGDPKVNNVMIDTMTGRAVGMIDLDTVKPGLVQYDIADCLRSGCNPWGEETEAWEDVRFDPDLCRLILRGYLSAAREFLTEDDFDYLFPALRLISFELGLRFFTDYLEGNVYFRANRPEHNLIRALVQFTLCRSIEMQEGLIRSIIGDLR